MYKLTYQDLKMLASQNPKLAISIYLPLHKSGVETREDPILFKKLMREAEKEALSKGYNQEEIDLVLKPFSGLSENYEFWSKAGSNSIAFFASEDFHTNIFSSENFNQEVTAGRRFNIKQLLQMLTSNRQYYILATSKHLNRFFICDKYDCEEIEIPNLPKNEDLALGVEHVITSLQSNTSGSPSGGSQKESSFHGQGGYKDAEQDKTKRYINEIDKALYKSYLHDKSEPLIIASVKEYLSVFNEVSEYKNILGNAIEGNHDKSNSKELHDLSKKIIEPFLMEEPDREFYLYKATRGKDNTSNELLEIIKLAYQGRIDKFFIHNNTQVWGNFDLNSGEAILQSEKNASSDDLVELATFYTIINGGKVYILDPEKYELKNKLAALLRF